MKNPILLSHSDLLKLSREFLKRGTSIRFQAKGWSMRPFIQNGDFITVSPVENSSFKIGDVVFYSVAEDNVIAHRIVNKYGKNGNMELLIKGDAGFGPFERVSSKDVLGKVVAIERNGKKRILDSRRYKMLNFLLASISPFNQWIYPLGSKVKHKVRRCVSTNFRS